MLLIRQIIAVFQLLAIVLYTGFILGLFFLAIILRLSHHHLLIMWHKGILFIIGVKVKIIGIRSNDTPTLFISNHSSYLDIMVLGSLIEGSFVAKKEIASWPVISFLAKLQNTYFVERNSRYAKEQLDDLISFLDNKRNLILFPEGTSNDGNRIYPFKATLFKIAEQSNINIQPVTVVYTLLDGMPIHRGMRHLTAWYGDMDLFSHLWELLTLGTLQVDVVFHNVVSYGDFASRKDLSKYCKDLIEMSMQERYHNAFSDE